MSELVIDPSLILLQLEAIDSDEVIHALSDRLHIYGAVEAGYAQATIDREHNHPTGLPTKPFGIAFPHADADGVIRSSLAVATLKETVGFHNMGDPEEILSVEIVFLLANREPEEQVQALRRLAMVFGQPEKLEELRSQSDAEEAADWLQRELLATT
ncbi:MAG: PTS sugar transporter subunit IIA [Anaerolineales bacterium]|nr:MAG: PTS sugar transporter subunit IIA [Anaerolineales bacterium]